MLLLYRGLRFESELGTIRTRLECCAVGELLDSALWVGLLELAALCFAARTLSGSPQQNRDEFAEKS
jgi:hypothetical protein